MSKFTSIDERLAEIRGLMEGWLQGEGIGSALVHATLAAEKGMKGRTARQISTGEMSR